MYVAYKIALHSISIIHQAALSRSFPFSKAAGCELYGRILTYFSCKYQRLSQLVILVIRHIYFLQFWEQRYGFFLTHTRKIYSLISKCGIFLRFGNFDISGDADSGRYLWHHNRQHDRQNIDLHIAIFISRIHITRRAGLFLSLNTGSQVGIIAQIWKSVRDRDMNM